MRKPTILLLLLLNLGAMAQQTNLSSELVWAERISSTEYVIKKNTKGKLKIYSGTKSNEINWKANSKILKDSLLVLVNPNERLFFGTKIKGEKIIFSERRLWIENAPNFRDLGGLKTTEGKTVAWGKLFRSGDMGKLTDSELAVIEKVNIKNVVDFRNEQELGQSTDRYPNSYTMNRVWANISPSNGQAMAAFGKLMSDPNASGAQAAEIFEGFYAKMPENVKNYAPFFKTLLDTKESEATLFHCTAGKDRTGFGSALILSVLGVPENVIVEEYYLSNRYTKYLAKAGMMSRLKPEIAKVLAGVEPKYIQATLNTIKAQYGSVNNMLEKELGIAEIERNLLKKKYLN